MKRKIYLTDIVRSHPDMEYPQLYAAILTEIKSGRLKPVKASGLNGKKPALYNAYWLYEEKREDKALAEEMRFRLSPLLKIEYYENNPEKYLRDREQIQLLSDYLIHHRSSLQIQETINERSFEIFHREKYLDREGGAELLLRLGLSKEALNFYTTSEPMSYYSHSKQTPQNFLIIENKDTFYSMRKYLIEGRREILNLKTGTLIYGGGKGIYRSFEDFVAAVEPYFAAAENRVYYFGDLDYEGILIYETLVKKYSGKRDILLFTEAYRKMLEKAEKLGTDRLPRTKEGQNASGGEVFFSFFSQELQDTIRRLLKEGKYIPQEILNQGDY